MYRKRPDVDGSLAGLGGGHEKTSAQIISEAKASIARYREFAVNRKLDSLHRCTKPGQG